MVIDIASSIGAGLDMRSVASVTNKKQENVEKTFLLCPRVAWFSELLRTCFSRALKEHSEDFSRSISSSFTVASKVGSKVNDIENISQ